MHRGNPLIEGLGFPLTKQQIQTQSAVAFTGGLDLSAVPEELHGYYTRSSILNLFSLHVVQDEMVEVYEAIRLGIEVGYLGRNPLQEDWQRILYSVERDKDEPLKATNIKRLNLIENSYTYLVCGLSGRGKSSMVKQALRLIDQTIEHGAYSDQKGKTLTSQLTQVTYLYVEHHERTGQKNFLNSVLEAIDEVTGEDYVYRHRNSNVKDLINAVRKAVILHHIGALVIDEAQNFAKAPEKIVIGPNEKTSMKFVEELVNSLGVSTIFVGTFSTLNLFTKEMTITRRTIRAGSMSLASCSVESGFWKNLCHALFNSVLLIGGTENQDALRLKLHDLSGGIPAIAVSIVQATLRFLSYFPAEKQSLTTRALDFVFLKQYNFLAAPINALIEGQYHKFEDLKPMLLLEKVTPKSDDSSEKLKDVERQAKELVEVATRENSKLMTGRVQLMPSQPPRSAHEVSADKQSEAMSPENLLNLASRKEDK